MKNRTHYPTKEDAFTRLWLPAADPHTPITVFQNTPPGLLKDLYPNIWAWGPRGDIYIQQLKNIITLLDSYAANPTQGGAFHLFNDHLPAFNMIYNPKRYTATAKRHLANQLERQNRSPGLYEDATTTEKTLSPLWGAIQDRTALLPRMPANQDLLQDFLNNFTYHSIHHDIHAKHKTNQWLIDKWAHYAKIFHLDTP